MSEYTVYSAPDDAHNPTIYENGWNVEATGHEDAVLKRLGVIHGYGTAFGGFWVSGPDTSQDHRPMKLKKIKFRGTAFEIYREEST